MDAKAPQSFAALTLSTCVCWLASDTVTEENVHFYTCLCTFKMTKTRTIPVEYELYALVFFYPKTKYWVRIIRG